MYTYSDIPQMQQRAEYIEERFTGDFFRTGIEVYVGSDPDVSGPNFIIDPKDEKGMAIFRRFAAEMAAHYKSLTP